MLFRSATGTESHAGTTASHARTATTHAGTATTHAGTTATHAGTATTHVRTTTAHARTTTPHARTATASRTRTATGERSALTNHAIEGLKLSLVQNPLEPRPRVTTGPEKRIPPLLHVRHHLAALDLAGAQTRPHLVHSGALLAHPSETLNPPRLELVHLCVVQFESLTHRHDAFDVYYASRSASALLILCSRVTHTEGEDGSQHQGQLLIAVHRSSSRAPTKGSEPQSTAGSVMNVRIGVDSARVR